MPAYKKENGTYYVAFYYKDWTGKRTKKKKEGFKTKREALEYERNFLLKENGSIDMNFKALVELYMEDCKARLKPTTYAGKEILLNLKILPFFYELKINEIDPATVRKWQTTLITDEKKYSLTYLKTINNQLTAVFNYAMKYYKLPSNPARIAGSIGKKNADSMLFWTKEEFEIFLKSVENKFMSTVIFSLLFYTGIRSGEMLALTLDDFNFGEKILSINKNYSRHQKEDLILEPKTPKSKRKIVLPNFICNLVKEYSEKLYDYLPQERLFPITKYYLHHEMSRGCKLSGVKRIRIHDLRHSHASLLIELGVSPLLIAERLGHDDIQTTLQTYSHLYPNKQEEIIKKLENL